MSDVIKIAAKLVRGDYIAMIERHVQDQRTVSITRLADLSEKQLSAMKDDAVLLRKEHDKTHAEIARLTREVEVLRADAERYRVWRRLVLTPHGLLPDALANALLEARTKADVDAAIDSARAAGDQS